MVVKLELEFRVTGKAISFDHQILNCAEKGDMWSLLSILKLKQRPRYSKDLLLSTVGINALFKVSFGRNCTVDVADFFIPTVTHLSTLIFMPAQLQQHVKLLRSIWFSVSRPVMTAALSAN